MPCLLRAILELLQLSPRPVPCPLVCYPPVINVPMVGSQQLYEHLLLRQGGQCPSFSLLSLDLCGIHAGWRQAC